MAAQPKLFALNILLLISLLLQLAIGTWLLLITRELVTDSAATWIDLHIINGLILVVLAVIHLYMNRKWVGLQLKGSRTRRKAAARTKRTVRTKKSK